jgi:hypothetical protein
MDADKPNQFINVVIPIMGLVLAVFGFVWTYLMTSWQIRTAQQLAVKSEEKAGISRITKWHALISYLKNAWMFVLCSLLSGTALLYEITHDSEIMNRRVLLRLVAYTLIFNVGLMGMATMAIYRVVSIHRMILKENVDLWTMVVNGLEKLVGLDDSSEKTQADTIKAIQMLTDIIHEDLRQRKTVAERKNTKRSRELID